MTTFAGNTSGAVGINNYGHADGVRTVASFYQPQGVAMDYAGVVAIVVCTMKREAENGLLQRFCVCANQF